MDGIHGCMKPDNRIRSRCWLILASAILLIGCSNAKLLPADAHSIKNGPMVVIDAGSSGSRLFAYHVIASSEDGLPRIDLLGTHKVEPGISAFEEDRGQGIENIDALVQAARRLIPQADWSTTPVYLLATAGMRLISSTKRERILSAIDSHFRQEGSFAYHPPLVLSGTYEGLYSWLAVNYLDDRFNPGTEREGMLEMGGASTQIAFVCPSDSTAAFIERSIRGQQYRIYSQSYLYMGENQARRLAATVSCYPDGFPINIDNEVGRGDFNRCAYDIKERFTALCESLECDGPHCIFERPPVQAPKGDYFAVSGFFYLYDFLASAADNDVLETYLEGGQNFCRLNWETIKTQHSETPDEYRYLKNYCFASAYYYTLLSSGFGFESARQRIRAVTKINATEVSWTLGAVLDIVAGYPPQSYSGLKYH